MSFINKMQTRRDIRIFFYSWVIGTHVHKHGVSLCNAVFVLCDLMKTASPMKGSAGDSDMLSTSVK